MKNKSSRHKEDNTFKFQSFSERISNIDVDIFHRIGHEYETLPDDADECNFHRTVQKWEVLNLTESYALFKKEARAYGVITLPQLIHNKDHVVEILIKHLRNKNVLSLQPLLEFVIALSKDLRNDFYPYYPQFLEILIDLLNTKDSEQLEWTFHCLAYLFKFLWRALIKDIGTVFKALFPLLSDNFPSYINNFAAESFAFVARKVKDKPSFLNLILKSVKINAGSIPGCGKLLFEVINGINGQFHSCAENFLPFLIESLSCEKYPQYELFQILQEINTNILINLNPSKCELYWNSLDSSLEKLQTDAANSSVINQILELLGSTVEFKSGRFVMNPSMIIKRILILLDLQTEEEVQLNLVKISILILLSKNIRLTQEQASNLTKKILSLENKNVLLYFINNSSDYPSFENLILPTFLNYCKNVNLDKDCFRILTHLIIRKAPPLQDGINLNQWRRYKIDFTSHNTIIKNIFMEKLNEIDFSNLDDYISCLICLPHINFPTDDFIPKIINDFKKVCDASIDRGIQLFVAHQLIESLSHLCDQNEFLGLKEVVFEKILILCDNSENLVALRILDLFCTKLSDHKEFVSLEILEKLHEVLEGNFNSPFHKVRLLTSHIYSLFESIINTKILNSSENFNTFTICFQVESIDPQVHTYRDQLQQLEKFNFDKSQISLCSKTIFKNIPLRYLCGVLYMNFKLLWEPVINIIASHGLGMEIDSFWKIYLERLKFSIQNTKNSPEQKIELHSFIFEFIGDLYQNLHKLEDKPDYCNVRLLLWKAMVQFPEVAERKTKDTSELLLKFIEEEYTRSNSEIAFSWNIKQYHLEETMEVDNEDETEAIKKELIKPVPKTGGKYNLKLLLEHLLVFSKIRSPKSMYREPELYALYFNFLSHKNSTVQKAALDCIMTYKFKYLTPYSQNLYNLIDDKNFKNELATFRVDTESSIVQPEHREELLNVVMRIVFSKMTAKTGLRTGGKASGQLRRNLVLRFLSGCKQEEKMSFIKMTFKLYNQYLQDDVMEMVKEIVGNVDLEKCIPPKRLQSSINLLTIVLEKFGNLMENDILHYLLKILFCIGASLKGVLNKQSEIHVGYLGVLRNIRTSSIKVLEQFFNHYDNFAWTNLEINAAFEVFIWPYLDKLCTEGIHSPTTLLKLLCLWGSNPRYFTLLMKSNASTFALEHVINLLIHPKSHPSVCTLIMESIEKLLTLTTKEEDEVIPVDNLKSVEANILDRIKINEKLNYGSSILLPFVPKILDKIKQKLQNKKNLNKRDLFILSRLSELVWEADPSDMILDLLLPIVLKKAQRNADEETITQFILTLNNLMKNVNQPEKHFRSFAPLFGHISNPPARKLLCDTLKIVSKESSELIREINAFDAKWVDQPDYTRRLEAFKTIGQITTEQKLTLELGVLLMYNSYYFISIEKDLSMRESASHCLKIISPNLIQNKSFPLKDISYLLDETLLNLIRGGLKSRNDAVRNEMISLLGHLARECPETHPILRDLNKLTNKTDLEVDFFENLTHLQVHRHGRALLKFTQVFKEEITLPNIRTLTQFILPITTSYLCTEKYVNKHSLIESAIETVGTACRLLPWHQYEGILKFYLGKLRQKNEFQKQVVKLIVHILDAFHFDLSKGNVEEIKIEKKGVIDEKIESESGKLLGSENTELNGDENKETDADTEDLEEKEEDEGANMELSEEVEDDEEIIVEGKDKEKVYSKTIVLCKSSATRVVRIIQTVLLPQLHRTLAEMTQHDASHKLNRKRTASEREEADLLRVPISLAVVKLLQRLPKLILDTNLPGVFMKLCTFLKSQLESVRRTARETFQKIMISLGPEYLGVLLSEISTLLSKGYQVHVLVYTVHSILVSLKDKFQALDIDRILNTVLQICNLDLFGVLAEEKEIGKIRSKTFEAKSTKSFDTYQILAQFITDKCLMDLVLPLKNILSTTHSYKIVNKAQECFRFIALGLVDNEFIAVESLLKFSYGTVSESIPQLLNKEKPSMGEKEREKLNRKSADCFIIPKEPVGKSGFRMSNVKVSKKTNTHILIEFGLRLCNFLLKRDKLRDNDYRPYIDPFVDVFKNCLKSQHVKLSTVTLQCLQWVMKLDLPSMQNNIKEISETLFGILHKYAAAGLSKGDNFDLVVQAFKTMSILVRDVKYHTIEAEQLKILLLYVEQDLLDHERQSIAFGLLKAIIARKLIVPEIHSILKKVAELSITSELTHIQLQSRVVFMQYMMDYPLGNKLKKHVEFYLAQLNYELQSGRESALEMVQNIIYSFPLDLLKVYSATIFISLGTRLVNDEVPLCRKKAAEAISSMITKLPRPDREPLFEIVLLWMQDKKISHRRLAAQLCGIMITVEKESFETRLQQLIPIILQQFSYDDNRAGKFVRIQKEIVPEKDERIKDHHLYQVLQMILKLCSFCPKFLSQKSDIENIALHVQTLLAYPHDWVRLASAQFLGYVLNSSNISEISVLILQKQTAEIGFIESDPVNKIKSLTLDLCAQLVPDVKPELAEQVIKNLVYIARVLENVPIGGQEDLNINLLFLVKRMRKIVNNEVVENPTSTVLRTEVFKWIAGVLTVINFEVLKPILHHFLAPLVREMITTEEGNAPLRQLAKQVANIIKKKIGMDAYMEMLTKSQQKLSVKRAERKRSRNQLAVTDPELYAKKKIKLNEKKKEAKKKKIAKKKGLNGKIRRKKAVDLEGLDEIV